MRAGAVGDERPALSERRAPWGGTWPLERVLFGLAGTMTIVAAVLGIVVSPWFLALAIFVGVSEWAFAIVGGCPASFVLGRALGLRARCA